MGKDTLGKHSGRINCRQSLPQRALPAAPAEIQRQTVDSGGVVNGPTPIQSFVDRSRSSICARRIVRRSPLTPRPSRNRRLCNANTSADMADRKAFAARASDQTPGKRPEPQPLGPSLRSPSTATKAVRFFVSFATTNRIQRDKTIFVCHGQINNNYKCRIIVLFAIYAVFSPI